MRAADNCMISAAKRDSEHQVHSAPRDDDAIFSSREPSGDNRGSYVLSECLVVLVTGELVSSCTLGFFECVSVFAVPAEFAVLLSPASFGLAPRLGYLLPVAFLDLGDRLPAALAATATGEACGACVIRECAPWGLWHATSIRCRSGTNK